MAKKKIEIPEGFKRVTSGKLQMGDLIFRESKQHGDRWEYVDIMVYGTADSKNYFARKINS